MSFRTSVPWNRGKPWQRSRVHDSFVTAAPSYPGVHRHLLNRRLQTYQKRWCFNAVPVNSGTKPDHLRRAAAAH